MNRQQVEQALQMAQAAAQQGDPQAVEDVQTLSGLLARFDAGPTLPDIVKREDAAPATGGNIGDALGQGALFGFSDEIGAGLVAGANSVANLFGAGTGDSFGQAYDSALDITRHNRDAFAERNPGTSLSAEIAGGLLTGGLGAAKAGVTGATSLGRMAGVGALQGAAYGAGASDADTLGGRLQSAGQGAVMGGAIAGGLPAAARATSGILRGTARAANNASGGGLNAVQREALDVLDNANVPTSVAQRSGSAPLRQLETTLADVPLLGRPLASLADDQTVKVQQNVLKMAGFVDDDVAEGLLSESALSRAAEKFSKRYDSAFDNVTVKIDDEFGQTLLNVLDQNSDSIGAALGGKLPRVVEQLWDKTAKGVLTGKTYNSVRSELGKLSRKGPIDLRGFYSDMQQALDDQFFKRVTPKVETATRALRSEYAHFRQLQDLFNRQGADVATGNIPMGQLSRLAQKSPGSQEWRQFARAANTVIPDRVPNSGTAARLGTLGGVGAGVTGGLLGLPAVMMSALGTRGVSGLLANPNAVQGLLQGVNQAGNVAGGVGLRAGLPLLTGPQ